MSLKSPRFKKNALKSLRSRPLSKKPLSPLATSKRSLLKLIMSP